LVETVRVELVVVEQGRVLFSRIIKLNRYGPFGLRERERGAEQSRVSPKLAYF